jgi:hypothetical protein
MEIYSCACVGTITDGAGISETWTESAGEPETNEVSVNDAMWMGEWKYIHMHEGPRVLAE